MEIYNLRIHAPSIDIEWIQLYLIAMFPWNGWVFLAPSLILSNSKPLPVVLMCYVLFSFLIGIADTIISFDHYSIGRMIKGAITWLIIYSVPLATSLVIIAVKRKLYKLENR
jgi:hypothetical protein